MTKNLYRNTAWLYDLECRDLVSEDIPFYMDYAKTLGGEVLELGCGTGRVSLALARQGIPVTCLDLSEQMLEIFREKLEVEPALRDKTTLVHGNMADFRFDKKFALVIAPFRAFQALTNDDDIASALRCIRAHLADNGVFIVNVFKPFAVLSEENWCREERVQWERRDERTGNHVVKKDGADRIDVQNQVIYAHLAYEVTQPNGRTERHLEPLSLRYYYEDQLAALVTNAGFGIRERFGWYDKRSVAEANRELIFVCGKEGAARGWPSVKK
jgi:ubiquinone/menaquinone biosynthesis C-methylase UbiE